MEEQFSEESIDPRLAAYFKLLQEIPARDPATAAEARRKFFSEMDQVFSSLDETGSESVPAGLSIFQVFIRRFEMLRLVQRTTVVLFAVLIMVLVSLFGGAGLTARAAQSSLPGDALYSVKTSLEVAQVALARDLSKEAELYLEFASRRLDEIEKLVEAGRYEAAVELSDEFYIYVGKALQTAGKLAEVDPAKAAELNLKITERLSQYIEQLNQVLSGLPANFQSQIKARLPLLPILSQDNENTNGNENANGNENGNENENDDNANGNANDDDDSNDNGDDDSNGNENANDNGDDDGNDNGVDDGNDNEDDDGNDNEDDDGNDNGDDDSNDNGDDDSNDNGDDDSNDNGDDDSNDNGDDDSNDNGDGDGNDNGDDDGNDNGDDDEEGNENDDDSQSSLLLGQSPSLSLSFAQILKNLQLF